ncbi:MAG: energy coupling factor transporter S component ThiW [Lachnospiraceae bacterium]
MLLGPGYGVGAAFAAYLIRNLMGLGSLHGISGQHVRGMACGLMFWKTKNTGWLGGGGGTSILGGLCAYPVAVLLMGKSAAGLAFYVYVFAVLCIPHDIVGVLIYSLKKCGALHKMQEVIG